MTLRQTMMRAPLVLLMAGALSGPAGAETAKSFEVLAQLVSGCLVSTDAQGSWGRIDFGSVDGASARTVDAALLSGAGSGIVMECTPGITASLTADAGDHALSGMRRLQRSGQTGPAIPYDLFVAPEKLVWGTQPVALSFLPGNSRRIIPVSARATLTTPVAAGTYTDTIRVTLSW